MKLKKQTRMIYVAMLFLGASTGVQARAGTLIDYSNFLAGANCGQKVKDLTKNWRSSDEWREEFRNRGELLAIKSPTRELGTWIFLEKDPSTKLVVAHRISQNTELDARWRKETCEANLESIEVRQSKMNFKQCH